jgi:hypothetical protein
MADLGLQMDILTRIFVEDVCGGLRCVLVCSIIELAVVVDGAREIKQRGDESKNAKRSRLILPAIFFLFFSFSSL